MAGNQPLGCCRPQTTELEEEASGQLSGKSGLCEWQGASAQASQIEGFGSTKILLDSRVPLGGAGAAASCVEGPWRGGLGQPRTPSGNAPDASLCAPQVLGLYRGLGSPLLGLTFINALVFGVQGNTLRALGRDSPLNQFLAGAAAGAIQCIICCPMELAKTRLQLQEAGPARTYRGPLDCLAQVYRREGLRGVNRGMVSTLLRETPSFGVYFLTYDTLTRALGCEPGDRLLVPKLLLAGGTSGIASWLSTYPLDVVKSRLQADGLRGAPRYRGILDCVRQSYRAEGWRVFTRGLASTLLRAFPVNAATFATVTVVLSYARGEEDRPEGDAVPAAPAGPALAQPSSL